MRAIVLVFAFAIFLSYMLVFGARVGTNQEHTHEALTTQTVAHALTSAQGALADAIAATIPPNTSVAQLPQTLTGTLPCNGANCTWSAVLANNVQTGTTQGPVVLNGGAARVVPDANVATDPNGNPVGNDGVYRVTITLPSGIAFPLIASAQILDSNPITASVTSMRFDAHAATSASIAYFDTLCGDTTIGCASVTANADTTVIQAQNNCFAPGTSANPALASACVPVGDATTAPQQANSYQNKTTPDSSNPSILQP